MFDEQMQRARFIYYENFSVWQGDGGNNSNNNNYYVDIVNGDRETLMVVVTILKINCSNNTNSTSIKRKYNYKLILFGMNLCLKGSGGYDDVGLFSFIQSLYCHYLSLFL